MVENVPESEWVLWYKSTLQELLSSPDFDCYCSNKNQLLIPWRLKLQYQWLTDHHRPDVREWKLSSHFEKKPSLYFKMLSFKWIVLKMSTLHKETNRSIFTLTSVISSYLQCYFSIWKKSDGKQVGKNWSSLKVAWLHTHGATLSWWRDPYPTTP